MTLMLLDSASLYFRAFFGVPESVTAPDGTPTNAVRGYLDMVANLVTNRRPTRVVACGDASFRPEFRTDALPGYKAHRVAPDGGEVVPESLAAQVPVLEAVLDALGVARVAVSGFEADDVIGTLAAAEPGPVEVVTGDRDLFQVVRDSEGGVAGAGAVKVLYTVRGVSNLAEYDEAAVAERYAIPGRSYADFAMLRGDPSDGLPGVAGVGEKTAATLITRFGSVAGVLAAIDAGTDGLTARVRTRVNDARDYLRAAEIVVRVREDVPVPVFTAAVPARPADPRRLVDLSARWGLDRSCSRVMAAFDLVTA